jgi:hypothetical protein
MALVVHWLFRDLKPPSVLQDASYKWKVIAISDENPSVDALESCRLNFFTWHL